MKKLLVVLGLGLLAGCAGTIQDRLDGGVKASVTTDKTPQEYVDCLRAEWVWLGTPNILKMENGFRYLIMYGDHVDIVTDIVEQNSTTQVDLYHRGAVRFGQGRMIEGMENCI